MCGIYMPDNCRMPVSKKPSSSRQVVRGGSGGGLGRMLCTSTSNSGVSCPKIISDRSSAQGGTWLRMNSCLIPRFVTLRLGPLSGLVKLDNTGLLQLSANSQAAPFKVLAFMSPSNDTRSAPRRPSQTTLRMAVCSALDGVGAPCCLFASGGVSAARGSPGKPAV